MKIYLMSSPDLHGFGEYSYKTITLEEALSALKGGFVSAVRYQWNADMLRDVLGIWVPINRADIRLEVGDMAVVVELREAYSTADAAKTPLCIGLLKRTA